MARELGGKRGAQALAAAAAIPFALGAGSLMQYVSFDYLAWVACSYFFVLLCKSRDPRWWLAIGGCIGFGMLTKYSMLVCALAIATGVLVTDLRADLRSKWLWFGVAVSLLIFLPNLIWQIQNDFVSLDFLRQIHERDVRIGRTKNFLPDRTGTHAVHITSGDAWVGFLLWIRKGTTFSCGRIFVRDFADYFLRCERSRLLSRSGLIRCCMPAVQFLELN
jgi:4-amino-4-deoxy-L-arabinose transferase-like glycosyltransferase